MHFVQLQQTQKELSRLQQLNKNLQEELQQERDSNLEKLVFKQVNYFKTFP